MRDGVYASGEPIIEASHEADGVARILFRARAADGTPGERHELAFLKLGDAWHLMPSSFGNDFPGRTFRAWHRLAQWSLTWTTDPASRGPAPTPELALLWAAEELPHAAALGRGDRVAELLGLGVRPTAPAVAAAWREGHRDVAAALMKAGAPMGHDADGEPLLLARLCDQDDPADALWLIGQDNGTLDGQDLADALYAAATRGHVDLADRLVKLGVDVRRTARHGVQVMVAVASNTADMPVARRLAMADWLIARGADVNAPWDVGSPLAEAVGLGSPQLVARLLEAGADPTAATPGGQTARERLDWVEDPAARTAIARLLDARAATRPARR